ncbi:MAG: tetratricopeptide repeat protein [Acidobacteria bacterium]|nr:tetratricopeptide repeat protein [Acidobacteriota bacterium]
MRRAARTGLLAAALTGAFTAAHRESIAAAQEGPTPAAQTESPAALAEVRRLINAGAPGQALAALQTLAGEADAARRPQIALLFGVAHYHADDPSSAIAALLPVVDRLPADSVERREAEQVLGLSLFVVGRFAEAVPRLEATRRWAPENLELAYALGQAYIRTHQPEGARAALASIYGVERDSAGAHLLTAQTMIRLELDSLAEPELKTALEKDARLANANFLLGQVALFRGRIDEAIALTERELAVNPGHATALSQLGDAYLRQGRTAEAIAALQKSLWLNPYYSAPYILLGRAYMKKGEGATAEGMLRRAIQHDPNNRSAHYLLAQLLQQAGREEEARREFAIAEALSGTRGP